MTRSLIFFGSDQYSATTLSHLLTANSLQLTTVITDHKSESTEVEKLAKEHNLKVAYYPDFNHSLITKGTLGLCASFDHLIPQEIIAKFKGHLYNLHPSLLPEYRNVSPVQYAIALGDKTTGITLFRIGSGIDNGEIIAQASEPILPDDTTPTLTTRLFTLGAELFLRSDLVGFQSKNKPTRSDLEGVPLIFTKRLTRNSGYVEWPTLHRLLQNELISPSDTTNELLKLRLSRHPYDPQSTIYDLTRALTPWPGVWSLVPTRKGDLRLRLVEASAKTGSPSFLIHLAGKPKPILYNDFIKYYLGK